MADQIEVKKQIDVAIGIIYRNGYICLSVRKKDCVMAGLDEFPGGKCEPEESPLSALSRELYEELGITFKAHLPMSTVVHTYDHATVKLHPFIVWHLDKEPTSKEGQEVKWVDANTLKHCNFPEANKQIVDSFYRPRILQFVKDIKSVDLSKNKSIEQHKVVLHADIGSNAIQDYLDSVSKPDFQHYIVMDSLDIAQSDLVYGHCLTVKYIKGLTLDQQQILDKIKQGGFILGMAHDEAELEFLITQHVHAVTLSAIYPTASHPNRLPLTNKTLDKLIHLNSNRVSMYALGGLKQSDVASCSLMGFWGVAGIRDFG